MRHELQAKHPGATPRRSSSTSVMCATRSLSAMPCPAWTSSSTPLRSSRCPPASSSPWRPCAPTLIGTDNVLHAAIEAGVEARRLPVHRQGGLPHQRHGHLQGHDGACHHRQRPCGRAARRHGHLLHPLRQRHVLAAAAVIPLFIEQIKCRQPHHHHRPQHDPLPDEPGRSGGPGACSPSSTPTRGDLFIQKADASTIGDLAKAVQKLFGDTGTHIIGTRHGEKLYETLMTKRGAHAQRGYGQLLPCVLPTTAT